MRRLPGLIPGVCILLAAWCSIAAAEDHADLYLLMGQSNMSGRGRLDAALPLRADGVWMYSNAGEWKPAVEPVDDATGQVDSVSADPDAGYGPALAFGLHLRRASGRTIGLVPCAKNGSTANEWLPATSRDTLYGSCLARAREARGHGVVRGVVWYQGESDAMAETLLRSWAGKFESIVAALRKDLNDNDLPVVFAQLGPNPQDPRFPFWDAMKTVQSDIAIPRVHMIQTDDVPADGVHLTAEGSFVVGRRFAESMARLMAR